LFVRVRLNHRTAGIPQEFGILEAVLSDGGLKGDEVAADDPSNDDQIGDETRDQSGNTVLTEVNEDGTNHPDDADDEIASERVGGGLERSLILGEVHDGKLGTHLNGTDRRLDARKKNGITH